MAPDMSTFSVLAIHCGAGCFPGKALTPGVTPRTAPPAVSPPTATAVAMARRGCANTPGSIQPRETQPTQAQNRHAVPPSWRPALHPQSQTARTGVPRVRVRTADQSALRYCWSILRWCHVSYCLPFRGPRQALIEKREGFWPVHVCGVELGEVQTGCNDERIDVSV